MQRRFARHLNLHKVVESWNTLAGAVVKADTIANFKRHFDRRINIWGIREIDQSQADGFILNWHHGCHWYGGPKSQFLCYTFLFSGYLGAFASENNNWFYANLWKSSGSLAPQQSGKWTDVAECRNVAECPPTIKKSNWLSTPFISGWQIENPFCFCFHHHFINQLTFALWPYCIHILLNNKFGIF